MEFEVQKVGSMLAFICAKSGRDVDTELFRTFFEFQFHIHFNVFKTVCDHLLYPQQRLQAPPIYLSAVWLGVAALYPPLNPPSNLNFSNKHQSD